MPARMRVERIDDARRIADNADLHAGFWIGIEIFPKQRPPELLIEPLFPRHLRRIDGVELVGLHCSAPLTFGEMKALSIRHWRVPLARRLQFQTTHSSPIRRSSWYCSLPKGRRFADR